MKYRLRTDASVECEARAYVAYDRDGNPPVHWVVSSCGVESIMEDVSFQRDWEPVPEAPASVDQSGRNRTDFIDATMGFECMHNLGNVPVCEVPIESELRHGADVMSNIRDGEWTATTDWSCLLRRAADEIRGLRKDLVASRAASLSQAKEVRALLNQNFAKASENAKLTEERDRLKSDVADWSTKCGTLQAQLDLWKNFTQTGIRWRGLSVWVAGDEATAKRFTEHVTKMLRDREDALFGGATPLAMLDEGDLKSGKKVRLRYENGREETVEIEEVP